MRSKKLRLTELLAGVVRVDAVERERLRVELAPISDSYLRRLPRASGVPLTPEVEGVRQEDFAALERTLLATTDRAAIAARQSASQDRDASEDRDDRVDAGVAGDPGRFCRLGEAEKGDRGVAGFGRCAAGMRTFGVLPRPASSNGKDLFSIEKNWQGKHTELCWSNR